MSMRHAVSISHNGQDWLEIPVDAASLPQPVDARRWLDTQFVENDCEPLRASGKLLTADKVLSLAATVNTTRWQDAAWSTAFAQAACAALGRPTVRIDLAGMKLLG